MTFIKRLLLVSLLMSGLTLFALHRAKAMAGKKLMRLGDSAMELMDSDHLEGRTLVFNGLTMRITTGRTSQTGSALLDAFESECRRSEGMPLPLPPDSEPELSPLLRWEEGQNGVAVCVAPADRDQTISGWSRRLRKFTETRDIADVGQVRYLRVMKGTDATTFVSMGSTGALRLDDLLPKFGDAPGVDMSGVPRPTASVRTLSAHEDNESALLATYKVETSPERARESYLSQVMASGLEVQRNAGTENSFVVHGSGIAPTYIAITGNRSRAFVAMIR